MHFMYFVGLNLHEYYRMSLMIDAFGMSIYNSPDKFSNNYSLIRIVK